MFSVARQQLDTHPLLECLSLTRVVPRRAIPFPTARSRWFDSRLRVVLRTLWLSGPPLTGDTRTGWSASAPAPVLGDSFHLSHPFSSFLRGIFPLEPPPRAATPSGSHTTSRRIVPPRRSFREGSFVNHDFSFSWASYTHMLRVSRSSRQRQVQPMYHFTRDRLPMWSYWPGVTQTSSYLSLSLPIPLSLSNLSFCSCPPIATMAFWASQAPRPSPPARPIVPHGLCACTSRRRAADPFVKLVSYLQ